MNAPHHGTHGQATFRGQIQDHDGRPIEGFVRVFRGDSPHVSRKVTGSFLLQLAPGHYRIEVHADGYQPVQIKLELHANQGAAHQFILNPVWRPGDKPLPPGTEPPPMDPPPMDLPPMDLPPAGALPEETGPDSPAVYTVEGELDGED